MKYYIVNSVLQGIQYKVLIPGKDIAGKITYFVNPNATNEQDEYYDARHVFSDYDKALQYFCQKCEESLEYYQKQIQAIKSIMDSKLPY
jgi:hypothetical protein